MSWGGGGGWRGTRQCILLVLCARKRQCQRSSSGALETKRQARRFSLRDARLCPIIGPWIDPMEAFLPLELLIGRSNGRLREDHRDSKSIQSALGRLGKNGGLVAPLPRCVDSTQSTNVHTADPDEDGQDGLAARLTGSVRRCCSRTASSVPA